MILIATTRSGLISLISVGLAQRRYAFPNLAPSSRVTVVSDITMMTVNHRQSRDVLFPIKPVSMRYIV